MSLIQHTIQPVFIIEHVDLGLSVNGGVHSVLLVHFFIFNIFQNIVIQVVVGTTTTATVLIHHDVVVVQGVETTMLFGVSCLDSVMMLVAGT